MVEIVDKNWPEMFKRLETALSKAEFVAIDNEFSGLRDALKEDISLFDDNAARYIKLKHHIDDYVIVQFGISLFFFNLESRDYTCEVFTVYLFPSTTGRKDSSLKFQASSVEFLCRYNFDFNQMMHHGLSYISLEEQKSLREALADGNFMKQQMAHFSVDITDQHKSLCSEVMTWALKANQGEEMIISCPPTIFPYLLHKDLRNSCSQIITLNDDVEPDKIRVRKVSLEERKQFLTEISQKEDDEAFDKLIGFSKFFSLLFEKDIPIVGHNVMLDMMMLYKQFIGPMPDSYKVFKKVLSRCFPSVFDTKYMSLEIKKENSLSDVWDSDLQRLYKYLSSDKCENFAPGAPAISTSSYGTPTGDEISANGEVCQADSKAHFHDAGWDSFCSGFVFVRLAYINALIADNSKTELSFQPSWDDLLESIQPLKNKVHISMGQANHTCLNGTDVGEKWKQIIHLETKNNKLLRMTEIEDAFLQFGSLDIKILDRNKALIAVATPECMKDILKYCKNHSDFKAKTYSTLKHSSVLRSCLWAGSVACLGSGVILLLQSLC